MSSFAAAWLARREPFVYAARDDALASAFLAPLAPGSLLVDLAAGTGSNISRLRSLAAEMDLQLAWRHVDNDAALLALAQRRFADDGGDPVSAQVGGVGGDGLLLAGIKGSPQDGASEWSRQRQQSDDRYGTDVA